MPDASGGSGADEAGSGAVETGSGTVRAGSRRVGAAPVPVAGRGGALGASARRWLAAAVLTVGGTATLLGPGTVSGFVRPGQAAAASGDRWSGIQAVQAPAPASVMPGAPSQPAREPQAAPARPGESEVERLTRHIDRTWKTGRPSARRIVQAAFSQGRDHGVSPTLILAIVAKESSFRSAVRNGYGAHGLMQVVPRFHPEKLRGMPRRALLTPEVNIQVGTRVLAQCLAHHGGRLDAALRTYSGNATAYAFKVRATWTSLESVRLAA